MEKFIATLKEMRLEFLFALLTGVIGFLVKTIINSYYLKRENKKINLTIGKEGTNLTIRNINQDDLKDKLNEIIKETDKSNPKNPNGNQDR